MKKILFSILVLFLFIFKANSFCITQPTEYFITTSITTDLIEQATTTIKTTSTTSTITVEHITTTQITKTTHLPDQYIRCVFNKKKNDIGNSSLPLSNQFSIRTLNLSCIVVYSSDCIHAIMFEYSNGDSTLFGNNNNSEIKKVVEISLLKKHIAAVDIYYQNQINSIQFLVFNLISNRYEWTTLMGKKNGELYSINVAKNAPHGTSFEITSISGRFDSMSIQSLTVGYKYLECFPGFNNNITPPISDNTFSTTEIIPISDFVQGIFDIYL